MCNTDKNTEIFDFVIRSLNKIQIEDILTTEFEVTYTDISSTVFLVHNSMAIKHTDIRNNVIIDSDKILEILKSNKSEDYTLLQANIMGIITKPNKQSYITKFESDKFELDSLLDRFCTKLKASTA